MGAVSAKRQTLSGVIWMLLTAAPQPSNLCEPAEEVIHGSERHAGGATGEV